MGHGTRSVTVEPWGITIEVRPDETVFDAAYRSGWQWPTNCYGQCRCTVCHVLVVDGVESLDAPDGTELAVLEPLRRTVYARQPDAVVRLACQTRPHADLRVVQRRPLQPLRAHDDLPEPEVTDGQH